MYKKIIALIIVALAVTGNAYAQSSSYCVYDTSTGKILEGNNFDARLEMASTTKVMTALIVLENIPIDFTVTIRDEWTNIEGSSMYLHENEIYTVEDLLYGLMLISGNDASVALACAVAGSVENFVCLMNQKADELGLKNTNFMNPHGLHQDDHYTSAYDLAIICDAAMKNEKFCSIVSAKEYEITDLSTNTKRKIYNKNKFLNCVDGADGIKIGYTTKAGRCLCASASRDGRRIICVIINHYDWFDMATNLINKYF